MTHHTDINKENLPKHIAIIMDGNGRWAKNSQKLEFLDIKLV